MDFDMSGKIISIGTALPEHSAAQSDILEFMGRAYNDEQEFRKLKVLFHQSGIEKRHSVLTDFGDSQPAYFKPNQNQPDVENRMGRFKKEALDLADASIERALNKTNFQPHEITHLITVTCTGMYAPGLSAEVTRRLNLNDDIFQTSVNFIGCNAAFHALKIADLIVQSDAHNKVLIVCVELCTLHFQPKKNTDNLLSNTIFGDGAASLIMTSDKQPSPGFLIHGFYSLLKQSGSHLMGWDVNPRSFEMILSAQIPKFIGQEIDAIIRRTADYFSIRQEEVVYWAVHPGGKKILDELRKQVGLSHEDLSASYEVLRNFGNMSSPTILFVLQHLMDSAPEAGKNVLAIGFGPGLTIDTSLMSYVG